MSRTLVTEFHMADLRDARRAEADIFPRVQTGRATFGMVSTAVRVPQGSLHDRRGDLEREAFGLTDPERTSRSEFSQGGSGSTNTPDREYDPPTPDVWSGEEPPWELPDEWA